MCFLFHDWEVVETLRADDYLAEKYGGEPIDYLIYETGLGFIFDKKGNNQICLNCGEKKERIPVFKERIEQLYLTFVVFPEERKNIAKKLWKENSS